MQTTFNEETTLIDLSIELEQGIASEPWPPEIESFDHEVGAGKLAENLQAHGYNITAEEFPEGRALAWEEITAITHTGTHMDAPWHYGPESAGGPSKTIEEVPLKWCVGNAVVLDFTWKEPRREITQSEVTEQLAALDHKLMPGDIVFIETGADDLWGTEEYLTEFPGMGAEATKYLVENGTRVIGTDAYGFDKPFIEMGKRYVESKDKAELWPAHFAGREMEYCQIEKMANFDKLPRRTNIPVTAFPVKIKGASGSWVRPVALINDPS